MSIERTYEEINARIKSGKVVVLTAEEVIERVREKGIKQTAKEVDIVTTGTFGPMCSSGVFLNFGHSKPRMRMSKVWLNNIPAYAGIAAVDAYLGATELPEQDPRNTDYPGEFRYGGAHVIEDLVAGKEVLLRAVSYGTDCYPLTKLEKKISLKTINEALLFNPRNCYQNYNCAVNSTEHLIYTYLGALKPNFGNAMYSTSGQLSPLLKDPYFRTIGIGTRIFLGGGKGYVVWHGTQHAPGFLKDEAGNKLTASGGTLAVMGDLKQMSPRWLVGTSYVGYGATLTVGIGIPIPILNEDILVEAAKSDAELYAPVVDYGKAYPQGEAENLGLVSYAQLKSGEIEIHGKKIATASVSSYYRAREIAWQLKDWISKGEFLLGKPSQLLPGPDKGE